MDPPRAAHGACIAHPPRMSSVRSEVEPCARPCSRIGPRQREQSRTRASPCSLAASIIFAAAVSRDRCCCRRLISFIQVPRPFSEVCSACSQRSVEEELCLASTSAVTAMGSVCGYACRAHSVAALQRSSNINGTIQRRFALPSRNEYVFSPSQVQGRLCVDVDVDVVAVVVVAFSGAGGQSRHRMGVLCCPACFVTAKALSTSDSLRADGTG